MALTDEIKRLKQEGMTEQQITAELQNRGYPMSQISQALSQAEIKNAVEGSQQGHQQENYPPQQPSAPKVQEAPVGEEQLQPSVMAAPPSPPQAQTLPPPQPPQAQPPQEQPTVEVYPATPQAYAPETTPAQYPQYQAPAITTSDTMYDIAEQIVAENIYPLRDKLEKAIDAKSKTEAKISAVEDRLKRIEAIIDKLQLSILQKVGEYVTDVQDIKKELVETQKSFKSLLPKSHTQKEQSEQKEHKPKHKK